MPFTFLSHQAPVLPLKLARPRWFSGTALVIGSMAPDLEYFLRGQAAWGVGHTIVGQFTFCLPLTLALTWLVRRVIARPLAAHLPDGGAFHLGDYQVLGDAPPAGYWLRAVPSALIGSFSHIVWDSFTHRNGWAAQHLGFDQYALLSLHGNTLYLYKALQHGSTLSGGLLTLWLLRRLGQQRWLLRQPPDHRVQATPRSRRLLLWPIIAGVLVGVARGLEQGAWLPQFSFAVGVFLSVVACAFVGLCLGCALCTPHLREVKP